jgi:hypothetical protein
VCLAGRFEAYTGCACAVLQRRPAPSPRRKNILTKVIHSTITATLARVWWICAWLWDVHNASAEGERL